MFHNLLRLSCMNYVCSSSIAPMCLCVFNFTNGHFGVIRKHNPFGCVCLFFGVCVCARFLFTYKCQSLQLSSGYWAHLLIKRQCQVGSLLESRYSPPMCGTCWWALHASGMCSLSRLCFSCCMLQWHMYARRMASAVRRDFPKRLWVFRTS